MPEGDTVWRAARRLHEGLAGHDLITSDFRVPQHATLDLSGQRVNEVVSRGKHLLIRVGEHSIHSHLAMEGRWDVHPRGTRWRRPGHAARVVLQTESTEAVGFWLAMVDVVLTADEDTVVGHLGPDLLGPDWDHAEAVRRLAARAETPIHVALLDQRIMAGLGNEYVNELLFILGLAPTRRVDQIDDLGRVVQRSFDVITANRDRSRRTFTGDPRPGRENWVYGRDRHTCRRCGRRIATGQLGDDPTRLRNTFWCPHCQT